MIHGARVIRIHHPRVRPRICCLRKRHLASGLLWAKGNWESTRTGRALASASLPKSRPHISLWGRCPLHAPGRGEWFSSLKVRAGPPQSPCSFQFHFFSMNSVHININKNWVPFLLLTCPALVSFLGSCTGHRWQRSSFSLQWSHGQNSVLSRRSQFTTLQPDLLRKEIWQINPPRNSNRFEKQAGCVPLTKYRKPSLCSQQQEGRPRHPGRRSRNPGLPPPNLPGVRWHLLTPESH